MERVKTVQGLATGQRADMLTFVRELVATPRLDGQLKGVGERSIAEMRRLGFDEARFDKMGNREVVKAKAFYALFPARVREQINEDPPDRVQNFLT